jgi:hypothetical protein
VLENGTQGEGAQVFHLQERTEEHTVQQPTNLLAILSKMAQKPEVQFDKLFQKLYNVDLWLLAYQHGHASINEKSQTMDITHGHISCCPPVSNRVLFLAHLSYALQINNGVADRHAALL